MGSFRFISMIVISVMIFLFSLGSSQGVLGHEHPESDPSLLIEEVQVRDIQQETNTTDEDKGIWESLEDGVSTVITTMIDLLLAPARAIATVFSNWANTISGPLGLLIA